jgi:hypothetical protein
MSEVAALTSSTNLFKNLGILVEIDKDNFLKVVETLTRIGLPTGDQTKLVQSCHVLHKQGQYSLMHFKELFLIDGKTADFSESDRFRRNTIAKLLEDWGLVRIKNKEVLDGFLPLKKIKIVPYKEKSNWVFEQKYTIGANKKQSLNR